MKNFFLYAALLLGVAIGIGACVKKSFDNPPDATGDDPRLPVNMTIMQLRKMRPNTLSVNDTMRIMDDYTISAIVNADDRSGNLYKNIYIQDSTGGIQLNIDAYSLYNSYPVGRRLYIRLKGMYLSYSGATGTPSLSMGINEQGGVIGLSGSEIDAHIVKGSAGNVVKDTVITFGQAAIFSASADDALLCRLVTIKDSVQFADTVHPYADPTGATNRYITLCGSTNYVGNTPPSGTMAVRNDNYANFHALKLPYGRGIIRGIYTVYRTSPQLILRDTADVQFGGPRCGALAPPSATKTITLDSLRKLYTGSGTLTLPALRIRATVISDITKANVSSGNFIIEDESKKGIIMYLSSGNYSLGDSLSIDVTGAKLQLYNGAMELTGLTSSQISKVTSGRSVAPVQLTIAQLNASFAQYESVLVKIVNATISGGTTYSGNRTLNDGTGSISLYTATGATFASVTVPATAKTYVGIATLFTPNEIKLRDPVIDVY